jgi:hypothetical protein
MKTDLQVSSILALLEMRGNFTLQPLLIWGINLQEAILWAADCLQSESGHGGNDTNLQRSYQVLNVGY